MKNNVTNNTSRFSRTILYQFLALALYEPTETLFEVLENDNPKLLAAAAGEFLGSEGNQLMDNILEALRGKGENRKDLLLDLKVEYNRLFVGPMPPVCPPYESYYDENLPKEGLGTLMGPTSEAMANALDNEGLELTLDYAELPDHMAIELEFMYYLLSKANAKDQDAELYRQKADTFLKEHLSQWLPEFGAMVSRESHHPFYRGIGLLLEATINTNFETVMRQ